MKSPEFGLQLNKKATILHTVFSYRSSKIPQAGGLLPGPSTRPKLEETLGIHKTDIHLGTEEDFNLGEKTIKNPLPCPDPGTRIGLMSHDDLHGSNDRTLQGLALNSDSHNEYIDNFKQSRLRTDQSFFYIEDKRKRRISSETANAMIWNVDRPKIARRGEGLHANRTMKGVRGLAELGLKHYERPKTPEHAGPETAAAIMGIGVSRGGLGESFRTHIVTIPPFLLFRYLLE